MGKRIIDLRQVDEIEVEVPKTSREYKENVAKAISDEQTKGNARYLDKSTYQVRAQFNHCTYNVEAIDEAEAEDLLAEYIKQKRRRALDNLQGNIEAEDILRDLNTAVEVEGETNAEPDIRQTEDGPERIE